jgi:hypothetical protein
VKAALLLMGLQALAFFVCTLNFRYCAKGDIKRTVLTDALIAALGFSLFKLIADATTAIEMAGYVLGASAGSYVAMRVSK